MQTQTTQTYQNPANVGMWPDGNVIVGYLRGDFYEFFGSGHRGYVAISHVADCLRSTVVRRGNGITETGFSALSAAANVARLAKCGWRVQLQGRPRYVKVAGDNRRRFASIGAAAVGDPAVVGDQSDKNTAAMEKLQGAADFMAWRTFGDIVITADLPIGGDKVMRCNVSDIVADIIGATWRWSGKASPCVVTSGEGDKRKTFADMQGIAADISQRLGGAMVAAGCGNAADFAIEMVDWSGDEQMRADCSTLGDVCYSAIQRERKDYAVHNSAYNDDAAA